MNLKESLIKEIVASLGLNVERDSKLNADNFIGKVCMFRTYSAGVHFGLLQKRNGKECEIINSHRVYSWAGACSLSQLSMEGSKNRDDCKIAVKVDSIFLTEVIEIIPMTDIAIRNLTIDGELWKK